MTISRADNKDTWNHFLSVHENDEFLQSWQWGDFQASVGNVPLRLQLKNGDQAVDQMQGIVYTLPFGLKFLYVPRYALLKREQGEEFLRYCRNQKFVFVRLEPAAQKFQSDQFNVREVKNRQPQDTLLLDIRPLEKDLLDQMHSKTRYNIRLAQKKGVEVNQKKDIDFFWEMNALTTARDNFESHSKKYYEKMLEQPNVYQFNAFVGDTCVASNICVASGNTFTYLHGASSNDFRNVMAPYLLQWEQIRFAKSHGFIAYDFWGIAPVGNNKPQTSFHNLTWQVDHALTGVSRFKAGFGGTRKTYPRAVEVVLRPSLYAAIRFLKKIVS